MPSGYPPAARGGDRSRLHAPSGPKRNVGRGSRMRMKRWIYVMLCTLAWLVPQAVAAVQIPGFPDMALWFLGTQVLALLTYPAGAVGILPTLIGIIFGIVTPIEALLISGPISLVAG